MSSSTWQQATFCVFTILAIFPFLSSAGANPNPMMPTQEDKWRPFCHEFRVHIVDGFSNDNPPFQIHCWSVDQDLGNHTFGPSFKDFNFKFGSRVVPPYTHFS
ncbi:hypothetical protein Tsubulata_049433, partial [Turnera subulata]